jgi:hypothetical protein
MLEKIKASLLERELWNSDLQERIEEFESLCILQIGSEPLRNALVQYLESVAPIQFFTSPASSTGRNHPPWQGGLAGILMNTVECCVGIDRKIRIYPSLTDARGDALADDRDIIYLATILSDTHKTEDYGRPWTEWAHHRTAAENWRELGTRLGLPFRVVNAVYDAIFWHLGRFSPEWKLGDDPREILALHTFITHELDMDFSNKRLGDIFERKIFLPNKPTQGID